MRKPLLLMRHRGLRGSFLASHAGISGLSKSIGQFVTANKVLPEVPKDLQADIGDTNTELKISWTATVDTVQYQLYREGVLILRQGGTTYTDTGLVAANPYAYRIQSLTLAGVESGLSSEVIGVPA